MGPWAHMTANVDIGIRLRAERLRLVLTQEQLCGAARVSKVSQVNYEKGRRAPDANYFQLVAGIGVDVLYVITGSKALPPAEPLASELVPLPRLAVRASAGYGVVNDPGAEYLVNALSVSRAWLNKRRLIPTNLRVITIRGRSMEPVLANDDLGVVDVTDTAPRSGFIYVIRNGDELLVKFCELHPGNKLRVSSANPSFAPYDVDLERNRELVIVGRVVASMHDW